VNIRKGFFGLTLILSILAGIILPHCHKWYFEESQVDINLPENWKEMPYQAKCHACNIARPDPQNTYRAGWPV